VQFEWIDGQQKSFFSESDVPTTNLFNFWRNLLKKDDQGNYELWQAPQQNAHHLSAVREFFVSSPEVEVLPVRLSLGQIAVLPLVPKGQGSQGPGNWKDAVSEEVAASFSQRLT